MNIINKLNNSYYAIPPHFLYYLLESKIKYYNISSNLKTNNSNNIKNNFVVEFPFCDKYLLVIVSFDILDIQNPPDITVINSKLVFYEYDIILKKFYNFEKSESLFNILFEVKNALSNQHMQLLLSINSFLNKDVNVNTYLNNNVNNNLFNVYNFNCIISLVNFIKSKQSKYSKTLPQFEIQFCNNINNINDKLNYCILGSHTIFEIINSLNSKQDSSLLFLQGQFNEIVLKYNLDEEIVLNNNINLKACPMIVIKISQLIKNTDNNYNNNKYYENKADDTNNSNCLDIKNYEDYYLNLKIFKSISYKILDNFIDDEPLMINNNISELEQHISNTERSMYILINKFRQRELVFKWFLEMDIGHLINVDTKNYLKGTIYVSYDSKYKNNKIINKKKNNYFLVIDFKKETTEYFEISVINCLKLQLLKRKKINSNSKDQIQKDVISIISSIS